MSKNKLWFVGIDGNKAVTSKETAQQIEAVKQLECSLEDEGERVIWSDLDDPNEDRSLFRSILADRKERIDKRVPMADRPSFCVITAVDNRAIRLEYYEGHDALELVYDMRSPELKGKELKKFLESDPQAYDPIDFLRRIGFFKNNKVKGISDKQLEILVRMTLKELHSELEKRRS